MGWFGKLVAGIVVVVLAFFVVTRFTDGPMGIITGGAFSSGEVVSEEPDWRYVKDYDIVEFQLLDPARSRTTWIVEHDGRIHTKRIYAQYRRQNLEAMAAASGKDGRAILRVDAKLYPRQLVRIKDDPVLPAVLAELSRKYANGAQIPVSEVSRGSLWIFELVQR